MRIRTSVALALTQLLSLLPSPALTQRVPVRTDTNYVVLRPPANAELHWRRDQNRRRPEGHGMMMPAAMRAISTTHWHVPEYHDEQRFVVGNAFGPYAYLYASPWLDGFDRMAQFVEHGPWGVLVGMVQVGNPAGGGAMPAPYANLHLTPGGHCLWLANPTGNEATGWLAYISPEDANSGCIRAGARRTLAVYRSTDPAFTLADFPAVARFSHAASGQPLMGFKCLAGWCEIGPPGLVMEDEHPGMSAREGRIKGWSDNQVLGQVTPAGDVRPSTVRASIIPAPNVNRYSEQDFATNLPSTNYSGGWVGVAQVLLSQDPPVASKYYQWGLRAGTNRVALRRASGIWQARVTPPPSPGGITHFIWENVYREPHFDAAIPATARWRVALFDDPIWVPCGQACCSVDGGIY